jgi:myo-inositol-hexaphosphate 3-phosphohydrolase
VETVPVPTSGDAADDPAIGPAVPSGVFVAQDGQNTGNQNFKLVPYERLDGLLI